jgi:hypothetical protein
MTIQREMLKDFAYLELYSVIAADSSSWENQWKHTQQNRTES